jgi:hypothetical protein
MAVADDEDSWFEIGGDYRLRYDNLKGTVHDYLQITDAQRSILAVPGYSVKNDSLFLNRFGLNVKAQATENISVKSRIIMYKVWGHQSMGPAEGNFFVDRASGPFDGTIGHVPADSTLYWDQAYATWSNIGGAPVWVTAGRRPTTGGAPTNLRQNLEDRNPAGSPGIMMDYAFDGALLGFSPKIDFLPGSYAKISYGKGFDSGYQSNTSNNSRLLFYDLPNTLKDTDYLGVDVVPYNTNSLHIDLQVQKGYHIYSRFPDPDKVGLPATPRKQDTANVGNITWLGGVIMGKVSDLNLFASAAQSIAQPTEENVAGVGLMWDAFHPDSRNNGRNINGYAFYIGGRYDITATGTKIGLEYNKGTQYWIGQVPAGDDIWTSKLGTRGRVYEVYLIQELNRKPIMKRGKAFFRIGYQYYKFDYTGSNNWMGAPVRISDLVADLTNAANAQALAPVQSAKDLYVTFDVLF